jgi:hypothetical protein
MSDEPLGHPLIPVRRLGPLPQAIEVRAGGITRRHLVDYDRLIDRDRVTWPTYCTMAAHAMMELRGKLIEEAILEGHDRIEVQVEGDRTTVHLAPDWFTETHRWAKVAWARWRHRHPDAGRRLLEALSWSGTVWSAATAPVRRGR